LRSIENYKSDIKRKGTEGDYIIQSNNFFGRAARWQEFRDATNTAGFQTGQPNMYNYPKCPLCLAEVSSIKLDEEGNLIYCPYCSD
jgi:DNA-directed RNA polymerase subunit RPC12/RpoP